MENHNYTPENDYPRPHISKRVLDETLLEILSKVEDALREEIRRQGVRREGYDATGEIILSKFKELVVFASEQVFAYFSGGHVKKYEIDTSGGIYVSRKDLRLRVENFLGGKAHDVSKISAKGLARSQLYHCCLWMLRDGE